MWRARRARIASRTPGRCSLRRSQPGPRGELRDQVLDLARRFETELLAHDLLEDAVLPQGFTRIPLCEVHADQGAMGALADRVPGDRGESGAECAEDVARSREALAQRLERV